MGFQKPLPIFLRGNFDDSRSLCRFPSGGGTPWSPAVLMLWNGQRHLALPWAVAVRQLVRICGRGAGGESESVAAYHSTQRYTSVVV